MSSPASVAVVLCCRDRAGLLAQALPAVRAELHEGDELVVVDSASVGDDVRLAVEGAGVRYLRIDEPGLSRARNAGWRATDAPVVLFTDDDCRPLPGWRRAGAAALADPGVGAVWGSVVADRTSGIALSVGLDGLLELEANSDLTRAGHGACMGFRREALHTLGGFDELLGAGGRFRSGEDKDAFDRVRRGGSRCVAAPAMAVTHVVHRDDRAARAVMTGYGVGAGVILRKRAAAGDALRPLLLSELWRHGLLPAARWAREGRFAAAGGALAKAAGVVRGVWAARGWAVHDGHLVEPGSGSA